MSDTPARRMLKTGKRLLRTLGPKKTLYPNWTKILAGDAGRWNTARASAAGPRILIATSVGGYAPGVILESALGAALTMRGARVHFLMCDEQLPACMQAQRNHFVDQEVFAREGPQAGLCGNCFHPGNGSLEGLGLPIHHYSQLLTDEDRSHIADMTASVALESIPAFSSDGVAIGEHALAGALRFYARGNLDGEPRANEVLRRYFHAALMTERVLSRLFDAYEFDCVCFHHGIYVPQGVIGEVARKRGVRVVNWAPAYRKQCFIFTHGDTYHRALMTEPTANWEHMPWTREMDSTIDRYLSSRRTGAQDWIWFHDRPIESLDAIRAQLGLTPGDQCIGLLTNVVWDAQLHYPANAFSRMLEWLFESVRYFEKRPDLKLIIRVHPAERSGSIPSRQPVVEELNRAFGELPSNVIVIGPDSQISTYAVMVQCNAVLIYGTKTGVELTAEGVPVIVGGEAWIRNKGITRDASSAAEYFRLLDRLPLEGRLDSDITTRARKYAYHFFFRRMIPVSFVRSTGGWPPYEVNLTGVRALEHGCDAGLDVICDGILTGREFLYRKELEAESGALLGTAVS